MCFSEEVAVSFARSQVLRHLFAMHKVTNFKIPFYLLMTMKLLPFEWSRHAEHVIRQSWSTAWGASEFLNALLFEGERIVPEVVASMRNKNMQRERLQKLQSKRAVCCQFAWCLAQQSLSYARPPVMPLSSGHNVRNTKPRPIISTP